MTADKLPTVFGGFNTCIAHNQGHTVVPAIKAVYTPLIYMISPDLTTMMTALVQDQQLTSEIGKLSLCLQQINSCTR